MTEEQSPEFIKNYIKIASKKLTNEEEQFWCKDVIQNDKIIRLVQNVRYMHYIIVKSVNTKLSSEIYKILRDYYPTPDRHKTCFDYWIENVVIDEYFINTMIKCSEIKPDLKSVTALFQNKFIMGDTKLILSIIKIFVLHGLKDDDLLKDAIRNNIYVVLFKKNMDYETVQKFLLKSGYENECDNVIINKLLKTVAIDVSSLVYFLDNIKIIPDSENVKSLLNNPYIKDKNMLQKIVNILVIYGLKINKELVLLLLDKNISVDYLEKHGIEVDEDIYTKCAKNNFYPYKLGCKPTDKIIHAEMCKRNNIDKIKDLKELGGIFDICCLEVASGVLNNVKVLKYLVEELKIMPNETCVQNCVLSQKIDNWAQLEILLKNYTNKRVILPQPKSNIKLNEQSTVVIEPTKLIVNKNNDYTLKNKMRKFLNYKNKTIKYDDLYELLIKYLTKNNLIIGNYFVIDDNLANLFKINNCSILHIDQLDNIMTYLIN